MRSYFPRHARALPIAAALIFALASSACSENLGGDTDDLQVTHQAIYYGTRSPSITNLTAGEQLAIGFVADSDGTVFCTATLIDRDVAVTARHCVEDTYPIEEMRFGMGTPESPSALVPVHSAPYHGSLDVALLLLQHDAVSQVPGAEPIPFLRQTPPQSWVGSDVEAAGYGATHDGSTGRYFAQLELTGVQQDFLVVNGHGQRGICFGDSGGPLLVHVDNGEPVIAGVESHGDSSCVDEDFLTRLDRAADWIDSQMAAFDPSSPPQTGPQGDGSDWCFPSGSNSGLNPADQPDECSSPFPMCSASPAVPVGAQGGIALGLGLLGLIIARRRGRRGPSI